MTEQTVGSLAALVGGRVIGDASRVIRGVADLRGRGEHLIGFVRDKKYRAAAKSVQLGAILCNEELETGAAQILVQDVGLAYAKVARILHPLATAKEHSVHASAVVHPEAVLKAPVAIGPRVVVGRARIAAGSVLEAGVVVGDDCVVGADCVIHPNVVLYPGVRIGNRVELHAGAILGSDGFGYANEGGRWVKVPQLGGVEVGDDVEIGANCTIDRGTIGDTRIGARSKIDNLCHIAHNCVVGEDNAFAAACFLSGSTVLGDRVTLGGHVVSAGHLKVPSDTRVGGASGLYGDVEKSGDWMGMPLMPMRRYARQLRALRELIDLHEEVEELRKASRGVVEG